jgi:hypothetical protein
MLFAEVAITPEELFRGLPITSKNLKEGCNIKTQRGNLSASPWRKVHPNSKTE